MEVGPPPTGRLALLEVGRPVLELGRPVLELGRAAEDDPSDDRLVDDAPVRAVDDAPYELRVDVGPPLGRLTPDVGRAAPDDEEVAVRPPKLNWPAELRLMPTLRCGGP